MLLTQSNIIPKTNLPMRFTKKYSWMSVINWGFWRYCIQIDSNPMFQVFLPTWPCYKPVEKWKHNSETSKKIKLRRIFSFIVDELLKNEWWMNRWITVNYGWITVNSLAHGSLASCDLHLLLSQITACTRRGGTASTARASTPSATATTATGERCVLRKKYPGYFVS